MLQDVCWKKPCYCKEGGYFHCFFTVYEQEYLYVYVHYIIYAALILYKGVFCVLLFGPCDNVSSWSVCNTSDFQQRAPSVVLIHNPPVKHSKAELLDKIQMYFVRSDMLHFPLKKTVHLYFGLKVKPDCSIQLICCVINT